MFSSLFIAAGTLNTMNHKWMHHKQADVAMKQVSLSAAAHNILSCYIVTLVRVHRCRCWKHDNCTISLLVACVRSSYLLINKRREAVLGRKRVAKRNSLRKCFKYSCSCCNLTCALHSTSNIIDCMYWMKIHARINCMSDGWIKLDKKIASSK